LDEAAAVIERDLSCVACGYNLRTLAPAAACPECGRAVAATLTVQNDPLATNVNVPRLRRALVLWLVAQAVWIGAMGYYEWLWWESEQFNAVLNAFVIAAEQPWLVQGTQWIAQYFSGYAWRDEGLVYVLLAVGAAVRAAAVTLLCITRQRAPRTAGLTAVAVAGCFVVSLVVSVGLTRWGVALWYSDGFRGGARWADAALEVMIAVELLALATVERHRWIGVGVLAIRIALLVAVSVFNVTHGEAMEAALPWWSLHGASAVAGVLSAWLVVLLLLHVRRFRSGKLYGNDR
jgi:hypothetical protein